MILRLLSILRIGEAASKRLPQLLANALLLLVAVSCSQVDTDSAAEPAVQVVDTQPGTVSKITAEELAPILEGLKGKPYVVNLWATWCMPCVEELPEFAAFYQAHRSGDIGFLSLSADFHYAIEDTVQPFVNERAVPFDVHVMYNLPPDELLTLLGVESTNWGGNLPATFVFDTKGRLAKFWDVQVTQADLEEAVAAAR